MQRANVAVLAACLGVLACGEPPSTNLPGYTPGDGNGTGGNGTGGNGTGGNGNTGGGNGSGDNGGGGGAGDVCQEQKIGNNKVIPEVLIVLDRSGSMDMGNDRWTPSVNAIKAVTAELGEQIEFGLMAFPGAGQAPAPKDCSQYGIFDPQRWTCELQNNGGGWGNADQCQVGSLAVDIGFETADDIGTALSAMRPNGGTPTALTLAEAGKYLQATQGGLLDEAPQPQYVLLVTDGEPNCGGDVGDTVKEIEKLAKAGVKTFVIGYEISGRTVGDMDRMAAAGDTGYTKHLAVQNEATLVAALREITGQLASCTVVLEEPVADPTYVLVTLNGVGITLNQPDGNGFSVDPEGRIVTILGESCEKLRNPKVGEVSQIAVSVECTPQILY